MTRRLPPASDDEAVAEASPAPAAIPVATAGLACGAVPAANTAVRLVLALVAGGPGFAARLAAWLAPVVAVVGVGVAW
ncbi:hypothetical protein ACFFR6_37880 [Saccharothrix mutabilis subsp. capreolus]|uniref:hypothetical protein n=1 Tax=Saccharothrix mutabilis TaxID=33921 RepID=UPI0035EDC514|nr:hypothetical protein GCM10017745_59850 [Saccharothrix mutabilis subsp. capreolus]